MANFKLPMLTYNEVRSAMAFENLCFRPSEIINRL